MVLEGGGSGRHCFQFCYPGLGMSLLCKRRIMPAKQRQHSGAGEGAGPTAPWDGPSFWAAGTSSSRGVALLFKASPLLSNISLASIDPHGRFVAAQCNLCGGQVTLASVYAPVERQERAPFFLQCLVPALPARTPLVLGGDWNCVARDQDLVGGQPGTRQHGFHSGLLPLQQALGLQDAFRHLHPDGWQSASFPERSGVQQGSPLSPLLYGLAARPLASHLRHQARHGIIRPFTMPVACASCGATGSPPAVPQRLAPSKMTFTM